MIDTNKLNGFPTSYYVSLEESINRQIDLENKFKAYNISLVPLISKRFSQSNDIIEGKYIHQLNDGTKGCCISHLKAIKQWFDNFDDDYGFFCEDDLSLETVEYWDFTWEQFIKSLPKDADCVQLLTIRGDYDTFELRERYWDDWGATAYIITRDYAKKIIDTYVKDNVYCLDIPNSNLMPLVENILFTSIGKVYTVPLFVEDVKFESTFSKKQDDDVSDGQKSNHYKASQKVLNHWKNKNKNMLDNNSELQKLLTKYSLDTENPDHNFDLGVWYENNGHTAPALSYFLRCAERSKDLDLAYEALIRGSYCYEKQGTRDGTAKSLLQQAICLLPKRPEAYFLLSRFSECRKWWQDCYIYAEWGIRFADFNLSPLRTDVEYPGYYGLLFEKAVSSWWWGKKDECKELFLDLKNNHQLSDQYRKSVNLNLRRIGVEVKNENKLSDLFKLKNYQTDKYDLGYIHSFYENFLDKLSEDPIKMLEIGVYNGGSIQLWRDYLHKDSEIYAGDLNYFEHIPGTFSIIGDMYSKDQISKLKDDYFDLIIDDGPHSFESFVLVMQRYFSKLKKGGTLVIEDVVNSSWIEPLVDLSQTLSYESCEIVDMTGKQKNEKYLKDWENGLYIIKLTK